MTDVHLIALLERAAKAVNSSSSVLDRVDVLNALESAIQDIKGRRSLAETQYQMERIVSILSGYSIVLVRLGWNTRFRMWHDKARKILELEE